jgi:diacylglycerol kinase (ATP)
MGTPAPVVVVANPTAGRGKAGKRIGAVDSILRTLRVDHEVRVTGSAQEMEETCRSLGERGVEVVAVLGGDGTASSAANGLLGTGAALSVLPSGTGDDFAHAVGAGSFRAAVELLANPKTTLIDVVRVRAGAADRCFLNVAGAGFDSEVNETANAMTVNLGGTGTYVAALLKTLSRFTPARYDLTIDGTPTTLEAMLVVVGNGPSFGGGMRVLPEASLVDGALDVCIVEALSKGAFLRAFPRVYSGRHASHPKVRMLRAATVTIEANRGIQLYADGERIGPLPARLEVMPAALPVVVGPDAKGLR